MWRLTLDEWPGGLRKKEEKNTHHCMLEKNRKR